MKEIIISAVRKNIERGHWYAKEDGTTEQQDSVIEQAAIEATLSDEDIIIAAQESGYTDLVDIANWAMSTKIGAFVGLNIKNK